MTDHTRSEHLHPSVRRLAGSTGPLRSALQTMMRNGNRTGETPGHSEGMLTSEYRCRRLSEAAQHGILILDASSRGIIDASPSITHLNAFSRHDLIGRQLWEVVREANTDFLTGLANKKHFEARLQDKCGRRVRCTPPLPTHSR